MGLASSKQRPLAIRPTTKKEFFSTIAKQNNRIFKTLVAKDERVYNSMNAARRYNTTAPLPSDLDKSDQKTTVKVVNLDTFDCAEQLTREGRQNVTCLNMANSLHPGGGYLNGSGAQEEALCRRSTLYITIRPERLLHPIPPHGGIFSPNVLIFRTSDDTKCQLLQSEQQWWTSVISVAAVEMPRLTPEKDDYANEEDRESTRERIKAILRIAAMNGKRNLVLGALGAGAFGNPPKAVARIFKETFQEEEFTGRFEGVWFAVIERGGSENYSVFKEILDGMEF
jgi:uncharacterized protein (TIGR02452 family)